MLAVNLVTYCRAMIVGPEGTPYENGIYVFDIFLPPNYPDSPPMVQFLTTGNGHVRYEYHKKCCNFSNEGLWFTSSKAWLVMKLLLLVSMYWAQQCFWATWLTWCVGSTLISTTAERSAWACLEPGQVTHLCRAILSASIVLALLTICECDSIRIRSNDNQQTLKSL